MSVPAVVLYFCLELWSMYTRLLPRSFCELLFWRCEYTFPNVILFVALPCHQLELVYVEQRRFQHSIIPPALDG